MKQTLNKDQFRFQFTQIRPDNFSYEGLGVIFDYLESLEDDCGIEMEFDPIAICCDFSQCSLIEFSLAYPDACDDFMSDEERKNAIAFFLDEVGIFYAFVENDSEVIFQNI